MMMGQFSPISFVRISPSTLTALVFFSAFLQLSFAAEPNASTRTNNTPKGLPRTSSFPKVERLTPTGQITSVSGAALIMGHDTIGCPLPEGESTFIISFLKTSPLNRFTFVNQNANVKGEMTIAVSNHRLPPNSPKWIEVSGKTAFTQKRRLNLSMVGVEARYVKLSFHVQKRGRVAPGVRTAQVVPVGDAGNITARTRSQRQLHQSQGEERFVLL